MENEYQNSPAVPSAASKLKVPRANTACDSMGTTGLPPSSNQLLDAFWRSPNKIHQIGTLDRNNHNFRNIPANSVSEAVKQAYALSCAGKETYFACAESLTPNSRTAANVFGAWGFWADVDVGAYKVEAGKGYLTEDDALLAVKQFCVDTGLSQPTHIVSSGGGLHVYWALDEIVERETWQAYAGKLKALTKTCKFLADDSRTADIASVLRIPGTLNYKYDPPRLVTLLHASVTFIGQSAMLGAIDSAHSKLCGVEMTQVASPTNADKRASSGIKWQASQSNHLKSPCQILAEIKAMLHCLNPDCGREDWIHVGMATKYESGGGEEGFGVWNAWSSKGNKYPGEKELRVQWRSFKTDLANPITIATIRKMVADGGQDWMEVCAEAESHFELCETTVIHPGQKSRIVPTPATLGLTDQAAVESGAIDATKADPVGTLEPLATIQGLFCLINMDGKLWVLDSRNLLVRTTQDIAKKLTLSNRSDGTLLITRAMNALFPQTGATKIVKEFFGSPQTICYDGVEFNPAGTSGNYLNLWVGPTIRPKSGMWPLIRQFLLEVICDGNDENCQYLLMYIAHALQRPWEKPGILIILLGGQGTGKGTLGRILRLIWTATYLQVHNIDAVTGNFNAALERAFIVFMDEALFVGDRRSSDALKSLVTEPVIHINEKHQPARQTNSYHRFFAATNADHLKNTERDDRRDFVLRVSEARKGDHNYWMALNHEIGNGGVEAMVHDLLAMDLSGFNVRNKPDTKELLEQKLQSLGPIQRWWHDCLCQGEQFSEGGWPEFISTEGAITSIWEMAGGKMHKKPAPMDVVQALIKLCPSAEKAQKKEALSRQRGLSLPTLQQARAEFEQYIGGKVNW